MQFIEKPDRVDRVIRRRFLQLKALKRRLVGVKLNPVEHRIFWEDLIESGEWVGDPTDDVQYQAFVDLGDFDWNGVIIRLVEGV